MFVVLLPFAGLLSGFITAALVFPSGKHGMYVLGSVFGAIMAVALALCGLLRRLWKVILLPVIAAVAYFLSWFTAGIVEIALSAGNFSMSQDPGVSPVSMFAGGVVGGFLVLVAISILVHPELGIRTHAVKTIIWSPVPGILGVVGWSLGPSLGMAIWSEIYDLGLTSPTESFQNALYGPASHANSLFVVWQTGMALVLVTCSPKSAQS